MVLHHPREAKGDPLDGQQDPGQASHPLVEHAASQEESGQHGQGAGQSEGETQGELIEAVGEEGESRGHSQLGRPLPVPEESVVLTRDGRLSQGGYVNLVALVLRIAQSPKAIERSQEEHHNYESEGAPVRHIECGPAQVPLTKAEDEQYSDQEVQPQEERGERDGTRQEVDDQNDEGAEEVTGSHTEQHSLQPPRMP